MDGGIVSQLLLCMYASVPSAHMFALCHCQYVCSFFHFISTMFNRCVTLTLHSIHAKIIAKRNALKMQQYSVFIVTPVDTATRRIVVVLELCRCEFPWKLNLQMSRQYASNFYFTTNFVQQCHSGFSKRIEVSLGEMAMNIQLNIHTILKRWNYSIRWNVCKRIRILFSCLKPDRFLEIAVNNSIDFRKYLLCLHHVCWTVPQIMRVRY